VSHGTEADSDTQLSFHTQNWTKWN